jgi:dienelactone hydrolase
MGRAAEPEFQSPIYPDKTKLLVVRDAAGRESPVNDPAAWNHRRQHILTNMQRAMGALPAKKPAPFELLDTERVDCQDYERRKISFLVEPRDRLTGYLLLPKRAGKRPAVLCLHQTVKIGAAEPVGLGGRANLRYAVELARRGYVTLAVDYPNFGDYACDVYGRGYDSATMKGIVNHRRAVDLLQSLDEVDPERIGVIGHSLGGHNSLFIAAFDERIQCVVTSCGFCSFGRYMNGDLAGWSHQGYMPRIRELYGTDPARMPFDFTEVLGAIAPRALLVVAPRRDANFDVEGVIECVDAAAPVYKLLGAEEKLSAIYPDAEHDFPPDARETAYRWMDRWIGDRVSQ